MSGWRRVAAATATLVASAIPVVAGSVSAAWALPATLDLSGHGYGHGRGMGQYGALGYANSGWTYQSILAHYYGGTSAANTSVATIPVSLSEIYGASTVSVSAPAGSTVVVNGTNTNKASAVLARGQSATATGGADLIVSGGWSTGSTRRFAGTISLPTGSPRVLDTLAVQQYVEGVVPRESPASWPRAALEAQAVAARSYALAYTDNGTQPICDSTSCQVFGGDPTQYPNGDAANSNAAVVATGSEVLLCGSDSACGSPTQVALTEFSSSTGGYTAGGAFPAVVDAGDATSSNSFHDWTADIPVSEVQSSFPSVGTLKAINITERNGLGDMGGRVLQMTLTGSAGTETITGTQFAGALGLYSDWFTITNPTSPAPGSETGYWVVSANGAVYPFGSAPSYGSMAGYRLAAPIIGMAPTGNGAGYWLVGSDGGIFSFGNARFYGSTGGMKLVAPAIGMASTPTSAGYWMVASDGGVFSFGDAKFYGSTGGVHLSRPIVSIAPTKDGKGYWMVASDGGVFAFGDAKFYGSTGGVHLDAPIVGMVPTNDGKGYWLVGADGGVFAFGDAGFVGSLGGSGVDDVVSVTPTPNNAGYLLVTRGGSVYTFGNATYLGDPASTVANWTGQAIGVFSR
ncbi:MAG TPA: SpoIID/LytB domain-containing protein [Acidimicrobiales bacterium]|jgi:SpoIID/LytB domain protein|nr:SpoIID/LytB domain-containing protein [Acidimicrobiales bacterium]